MDLSAENLNDLQVRGVRGPFAGEIFRIAILGCKGDWPYLQKAGNLNRCYSTAAKRGDSKKVHGICHRYMAGLPQFPPEQLDSTRPEWLKSVGIQLPWNTTPPLLKHLLHDRSNPATFFLSRFVAHCPPRFWPFMDQLCCEFCAQCHSSIQP